MPINYIQKKWQELSKKWLWKDLDFSTKPEIKEEIWVLSDNRPGTIAQSIGLAEEMGFSYKIINLTYNIFIALPNRFFSNSLIRLSQISQKKFQNLQYFPKIIISAGRRSATTALYLKKQSQGQTKIIQIMNPDLDLKKFDFVILPKHDRIDGNSFPNLITTIGSLTKVNDNVIALESDKFSSWFNDVKKTKIALLVGGSSNKTKFEKDSIIKLAKISSQIAKNMDATLLILNSRRTGKTLSKELELNMDCDFRFFNWEDIKDKNPYLAILGYADFFIITGDSVSMISECCSTGKPVYIFDEKSISSFKHKIFHANLYNEGYAKKLEDNYIILEDFSSKKLQETKRISNLIKAKF